jgi:hypothetical protein
MTGSAPKLAEVSMVAPPTRRSGACSTSSRSVARTVRASRPEDADGAARGSVSVTAAASKVAAASASSATSGDVAAASTPTSAGPSVPASP